MEDHRVPFWRVIDVRDADDEEVAKPVRASDPGAAAAVYASLWGENGKEMRVLVWPEGKRSEARIIRCYLPDPSWETEDMGSEKANNNSVLGDDNG